jgi:hypothetical protein
MHADSLFFYIYHPGDLRSSASKKEFKLFRRFLLIFLQVEWAEPERSGFPFPPPWVAAEEPFSAAGFLS